MKLHTRKVNKTQRKAMLQELIQDPAIEPVSYSMKEAYDLGDFLLHPKYGPGFVERLIDSDKIQVFFDIPGSSDDKILLHNRCA